MQSVDVPLIGQWLSGAASFRNPTSYINIIIAFLPSRSATTTIMPYSEDVLLELASYLSTKSYVFICPTPESQERVVTKRRKDAKTRYCENLTDFFGWSLSASV